jgi:hypothetical protein
MSLGDMNQTERSRGMFMLKQSADIYTAMMILAFVFICIGCLFLFLEMKAYDLSVHVPADAKVPAAPQSRWTPDMPERLVTHDASSEWNVHRQCS